MTHNRIWADRVLLITRALLAVAALAAAKPAVVCAATVDLLISGGRVLDGTGNPWFAADVAVDQGRIVAVGKLDGYHGRTRIDANGCYVVPGFIDLHSHADDDSSGDKGLRSRDSRRRAAPNVVAQGITTLVVNPDGSAPPMSIAEQTAELRAKGFGPNVVLLAGHNTLRRQIMGEDYRRAARPDEVMRMRALVRRALQEGAFGLSAGLEYVPGRWSDTAELIELARELPAFGGLLIAHMRSEAGYPMWWLPSRDEAHGRTTLTDALQELIRIGETTGATVVATHLKARGTEFWGASTTAVPLIAEARRRGVAIYGDQYPYNTSFSDGHIVLVPGWAIGFDESAQPHATRKDYAAALRATLRDPANTERVRRDVAHAIAFRGGAENIIIMDAPDRSFLGKTLAQLARARDLAPEEMAIRLQLEGDRSRPGGVRARSFSFAEDDIVAFMREPWVATSTDGEISLPEDGPVHARNYGAFVRKLAWYALERKVISFEHAIRAATSLPAQILSLTDRGCVRVGCMADIVVLDPAKLQDHATFEDPHRYPTGVEHVLVGGEAVVANGRLTAALPGTVLSGTGRDRQEGRE